MASEKNEESNGNVGGRVETLDKEPKGDSGAALASLLYLLISLAFFSWILFDTWIGRNTLPGLVGYDRTLLNSPTFRLITYTVIGGGLGGIINGIRSCLMYYRGFDRRYTVKYVAAPWMGATLALFVYALIRSSIGVFGGGAAANNGGTPQALANFAAGALAGYGSKDVFIWLDAQVQKLFRVPEQAPDLKGKTEEGAVSRIHAKNLELGEVTKVQPQGDQRPGTVVDQAPSPEATIDRGAAVDITVATPSPGK
jgi:hypothetical protein